MSRLEALVHSMGWKDITPETILKQILDAESPETAYVVDDYPYGWRLRTKIRYWVESKPKYGQRLGSQTLNPKTGRWNTPHYGTYIDILVIGLNNEGHLISGGIGAGVSESVLDAFIKDYKLTPQQLKTADVIRAWARVNSKVTWTVRTVTDTSEEPSQSLKEQSQILNDLAKIEYIRIQREKNAETLKQQLQPILT